jgi:hypothetical protein
MNEKFVPPEIVEAWANEMQERGIARSDAACARLLGTTPRNFLNWKRQGVDRITALAFTAALERLPPYGGIVEDAKAETHPG